MTFRTEEAPLGQDTSRCKVQDAARSPISSDRSCHADISGVIVANAEDPYPPVKRGRPDFQDFIRSHITDVSGGLAFCDVDGCSLEILDPWARAGGTGVPNSKALAGTRGRV